jgi:hypothetical protein
MVCPGFAHNLLQGRLRGIPYKGPWTPSVNPISPGGRRSAPHVAATRAEQEGTLALMPKSSTQTWPDRVTSQARVTRLYTCRWTAADRRTPWRNRLTDGGQGPLYGIPRRRPCCKLWANPRQTIDGRESAGHLLAESLFGQDPASEVGQQ